MNRIAITITLVLLLTTTAAFSLHSKNAAPPATPKVALIRTPHDGIQPQTVLDRDGVLHMIYFKGDASAGDIEYVRRQASGQDFSQPIRVNSETQSAVAIGSVRGPQLAIGRNGRAYAIWFGPQSQAGESRDAMPVFFSRLNDSRTAFEPQRNLMQYAKGGDGGISVAADARGDVYAVWHAMGTEPGEDHRRVYLARSTDEGKTFAREAPISPAELGACGCCGMRAFADERGTLFGEHPSGYDAADFNRPRRDVPHEERRSLGTECLSHEYGVPERGWTASTGCVGDGGPSVLRRDRTGFPEARPLRRCAR